MVPNLYAKRYNVKKILILTTWLLSFMHSPVHAQQSSSNIKAKADIKPFYITTGIDGAIFSSAIITNNGAKGNGTPRFSLMNAGMYFHFNPSEHFGVFTGADIKNIGVIEVRDAVSNKKRVYTLGVPVGIKIGNMEMTKTYGFIGGGIDLPFNYREKVFYIRNQKTIFNEWFSKRTPSLMPYLFAGIKVRKGLSFKAQYYPGNFLNPNFKDNTGKTPYAGYDVHLVQATVGYMLVRKKDRISLEANNVTE